MTNQRQQHDLQQGSSEWHEFRAHHIGASEIAAVLGLSKYTTRTELLKIKSTGIAPDVDANTQRIFDRGHETESLARPIAEKIIGEELYPTTWSYGELSASCDGLTAMDDIGWEHKQFNKDLFEQVLRGELPDTHMPQVQQCLLVTGADKWLFMVSDGTEENCAHMWVYPEQSWFERIELGSSQFFIDRDNYSPEPEVIEAKAEPVMALPALSINVGGSISIQSNLEKFGERLRSFIEETNAKPETDQDFANLEQACKVLKEAEDALKQAESNALAQTASVDEMRRTVAFLADTARNNRLQFEKIVRLEKENRKAQIVFSAKSALNGHVNLIQTELPVTFGFNQPNFADAIKGKKTLSSMQDVVNTMLANAKIDADALARELREKLSWYEKSYGAGNGVAGFNFLFPDLHQLIYKQFDDFKLAVDSRVNQHKEQERLKAESAAKAQAEREERIRREAEEKAQREAAQREEQIRKDAAEQAAKEERARIEAERAKEAAEQDAREKIVTKAVQEVEAHQEQLKTGFKDPTQGAPAVGPSPGRKSLIMAVASKYFVTPYEAEQWLTQEFSKTQSNQQEVA